MGIEEKAKAYDMALEAARKELGVDRKEWEVVQRVLHNIFPELRESEDERIRRKMIEHFKSKTKETWCNMPVKDILAWLEKQKEQKPVDDDPLNDPRFIDGFDTGREVQKIFDEPTEWGEEDEKKIGRLRSVVNQLASYTDSLDVNGDYCEGDYAELDTWLKSLRPQPHWKPSEEQIDAVRYFVNKHQSEAWAATSKWKQFTALRELLGILQKLM